MVTNKIIKNLKTLMYQKLMKIRNGFVKHVWLLVWLIGPYDKIIDSS